MVLSVSGGLVGTVSVMSDGQAASRGGLVRGTSLLVAARVGGAAIAALVTPLLIRGLGLAAYGTFSTVVAFAMVVTTVFELGIGFLAGRDVARHEGDARSTLVARLFALRMLTAIPVMVILGGCAVIAGHVSVIPGSWRGGLIILALTVPATYVQTFLMPVLPAVGRPHVIAVSELVNKAIWFAGALFAATHHSLVGVVAALQLALVLQVVLLLVASRDLLRTTNSPVVPGRRRLLVGALSLSVLPVVIVLYSRIDLLVLSAVRGAVQAGIYSLCYRFSDVLLLLAATIAVVLQGRLANTESHLAELDQARTTFVIPFAGICGLVAASGPLVLPLLAGQQLAGQHMSGAVATLGVLMVASCLAASNQISMMVLLARRAHRFLTVGLGVATFVEIAGAWIGATVAGTVGVACGLVLAEAGLLVGIEGALHREMDTGWAWLGRAALLFGAGAFGLVLPVGAVGQLIVGVLGLGAGVLCLGSVRTAGWQLVRVGLGRGRGG